MATKTLVELVDDIDGGPADETIEFGFRGNTYEIDLAEDHIKELAEFLGPFIEVARRTSAPTVRGRATQSIASAAARRSSNGSANYAGIRAWAAETGIEVNPRGRIPQKVIDAYHARSAT